MQVMRRWHGQMKATLLAGATVARRDLSPVAGTVSHSVLVVAIEEVDCSQSTVNCYRHYPQALFSCFLNYRTLPQAASLARTDNHKSTD